MSDRFTQERDLRARVEHEHGALRDMTPPQNPREAAQLAKDAPDVFDALFEAGMIPRSALGWQEGR